MERPLRHIIEDFVSELNFTFNVLSYSVVGDNTQISIDNILHLRKGLSVSINGTDYEVINVLSEKSFIIEGKPAGFTTVILPIPFYFAGTPEFAIDMLNTRKRKAKFPFIYLYEVISEQWNTNKSLLAEREAEVLICFLDESNVKEGDKIDNMQYFYDNIVDGQYRLAHYFRKKAYKSKYFGAFDNFRLVPFPKWGKFANRKGMTSREFDEDLSGVEMQITLPVLKETEC